MATYTQQCSKVGSFSYANNFVLYVILTERDVSINDNTSYIDYNVYCQSSGSGSINSKHLKYFSINGEEKINTTETVNASSPNAYISIASGSIGPIKHNDDGTKTISFSAQIQGASYGVSASISSNFTLTTIQRKSQVGLSSTSITLGNALTIYTNSASSNFTHNLYWQVGGGSWNTIAKGVTNSYVWNTSSAISSIAAKFPNSKTGNLTVNCETYNGSTYLGHTSTTLSFTITSQPIVSSISTSGGINGVFVEDVSNVTTNVTASGIYGSSISSYRVEMYNGSTKIKESYGSSASATFVLSGLNLSADATITLKTTVTDTRGNSGTGSTTITVKDYFKPQITSRSAYRCNSSGTADSNGTYLRIYWAYSTKSISGVTTDTAKVQYRQKGASSWTSVTVGNAVAVTVGGGAISTDYQYEVQFSISDNVSTPTVVTDTIPTGSVTVDYRAGGKGIAFGKVSEKDEFECNMVADFKNTISWESIGYTNTDYNTMKKSGIYYMSTGCSNSPEGQRYLRLLVMGASYSGDVTQIATNVATGNTWIRACSNGTWHDWAKVGTAVKKVTQTSTAGWYRVAILRGAGHSPNNAVILNVSTNYNYNLPCSVMLAIITSFKKARITQLTAVDTSNNPSITQARVQYDETNANFYVDVYYNKSSLNAILVRNENILDKQTEIYAPYHITSSSLTDIDKLEIDYTGTNLRPRIMLTAKPSSNLSITGTAWANSTITLNAIHGLNLADNKLNVRDGGIYIVAGVKKVKVSGTFSFYNYPITGEVDFKILKYGSSYGTIVIRQVYGVCPISNHTHTICINPFAIDVTAGDIITMGVVKSSADAMTVLSADGSTSLTVEVIG